MFKKPSLLIDIDKCKSNIVRMSQKAKIADIGFRPHFKTHQSAEIGKWFREQGVGKITVSSVDMAQYFADHGWKNILIAFPVNIHEIDQINKLASRIELFLVVESEFTINFLSDHLKNKVSIYIEIDEGYHRTGIAAENLIEIKRLLSKIKNSDLMQLKGFMAHFGQTYSAKDQADVKSIFERSMKKLSRLKHEFKGLFPEIKVSVGDTPSCSMLDNFEDADEIRPGNFVFYDVMQHFIGSCNLDEIALVVACPIIGIYPERNEMAIYGGAIHLSKEYCRQPTGENIFGLVVQLTANGWGSPLNDTYVSRLSQEHGIIKTTDEILERFSPGDIIGILPVHSCLTANLANEYLTTDNHSINKMRS